MQRYFIHFEMAHALLAECMEKATVIMDSALVDWQRIL
jgi:hypothetical protein